MPEPAELLAQRTARLQAAYELRIPDRVPISIGFGYLLARLGGITCQELESNHARAQELLEEYALYYEPDIATGNGYGFPPRPSIILGDRQTRWPGYQLDPNAPFQVVEGGVTPSVFYEGVYDTRLNYLRELPRGKTISRFDRSEMVKVKEVVGDVMCIQGGFPVSLLTSGTSEEIRSLTKEFCEGVGKGGGYIMATNTAMHDCRRDLVKIWVDATKEYGVYA